MEDLRGPTLTICKAGGTWREGGKEKMKECIYFQSSQSDVNMCIYHEECDYGCVGFCNLKVEFGRRT